VILDFFRSKTVPEAPPSLCDPHTIWDLTYLYNPYGSTPRLGGAFQAQTSTKILRLYIVMHSMTAYCKCLATLLWYFKRFWMKLNQLGNGPTFFFQGSDLLVLHNIVFVWQRSCNIILMSMSACTRAFRVLLTLRKRRGGGGTHSQISIYLWRVHFHVDHDSMHSGSIALFTDEKTEDHGSRISNFRFPESPR